MAQSIKVYYDREGDFLEVLFFEEAGFMRATDNDEVMERVSKNGKVLGFTVMQVSRHDREKPLIANLA
jgi:uncharacterized protein YuzE